MATKSEEVKELLNCPICMELYREPVSTPCQHNFCRECLYTFAESFQSTEVPALGEADGDIIISCPTCRGTVNLGNRGGSGLPVNLKLAEIVETFQPEDMSEEFMPYCLMCDDESKSTRAVKFCSSCGIVYCDDCFNSLHPMRGPLKRHTVMSIEKYLSQCKIEASRQVAEESQPRPSCEEHSVELVLYCVTCESLMCNRCFSKHNHHVMSDIKTAYESAKDPFTENLSVLEEMEREIETRMTDIESVMADIQSKSGRHKTEYTKAYTAALASLETWYKDSIDGVDKRHGEWYSKCQAAIKNLELKRDEVITMSMEARELLSAGDALFIKDVKTVSARISNLLPGGNKIITTQEEFAQNLRLSLERDTVTSKRVIVRETISETVTPSPLEEKPIFTPLLKFTRTDGDHLDIRDGGAEVVQRSGDSGYVWTDRRVDQGRVYWEMIISPNLSDASDTECYFDPGVWQEGEDWCVPGETSWGIRLIYLRDLYRCDSYSDNIVCQIHRDYKDWTGYSETHRIGLLLDSDTRTLKVIDLSQKQVMCEISEINVTKQLIPRIDLCGDESPSVRLVPPESQLFTPPLCNLLDL